MSLAAIFPSFTTTETHDTAMMDDAQLPPASDMDMSPQRDPMQSFTATPSMEWGVPSRPQVSLGDQSMVAEGALDTSMYGESGPVDMEMTAEYDMTMDDDVIQHQNYEMHMTDAVPIAPVSLESAVPLVAGHVYATVEAEVDYPVPTPVLTVDPGFPAPAAGPLHTNSTEVAQVPLYSPQDTFNTVAAPILEFYAPAVAPTGPDIEVASGPAPSVADSAHDEPAAAVAEPLAPPEPETAVEHDVQSADQVVIPVQAQPADADADADADAGEHYHTSHPAQEPELETAHVTEIVSHSEDYRQVEQEAPPAESVKPQEETHEPYASDPPALGIPPILLSIPFSPASSPTHSAPLSMFEPLYSLFSKPDVSTLPSSSSQPRPPDVHLLLADRPQMFFENVATLLHAIRGELLELQGGGFRKDMFEFMEMILHARQLDLTLPEDNIHAQSISLYDFAALHQSCAVPGYLHLDLMLKTRFKSRWDEIKRAVSEQEREYEAEAYTEHNHAGPGDEGHEVLAEQAPLTTIHEEQADDGTAAHAEDSYQPEVRVEFASTPDVPHQAPQQQQTTNDQPPFDLSDFLGFEEPPLDDDDDNWDDDDTAKVVNQTSDTFPSFANTEVPAQNNEGQEGQEQYTNSHQFSEGEGVSAEYTEYTEGEWAATEKHESEGVPTEAAAPPAGQEEQARTIEAGDEVAQYDGEEYIGPEYEYVYDESEGVEGRIGEWTEDEEPLNTATDPRPEAVLGNSQDVSTQQDDAQVQTTQESAATATTVSLHHLPVQTLGQQQGHEQPEGETQELEEYYDTEDGDTREYFGKYDEGDAKEGDGSPEHPINLTDVHGSDDQPAEARQVYGDPETYIGEQDVDEISTLEGSPSQDDQPALPETEVGDELVNLEDAADDPVLVDTRAGMPVQHRPSGQKRQREDIEAEENLRSEVKRARLS